jgi:hypothetical protein
VSLWTVEIRKKPFMKIPTLRNVFVSWSREVVNYGTLRSDS